MTLSLKEKDAAHCWSALSRDFWHLQAHVHVSAHLKHALDVQVCTYAWMGDATQFSPGALRKNGEPRPRLKKCVRMPRACAVEPCAPETAGGAPPCCGRA